MWETTKGRERGREKINTNISLSLPLLLQKSLSNCQQIFTKKIFAEKVILNGIEDKVTKIHTTKNLWKTTIEQKIFCLEIRVEKRRKGREGVRGGGDIEITRKIDVFKNRFTVHLKNIFFLKYGKINITR